jgi:hypothetical protein
MSETSEGTRVDVALVESIIAVLRGPKILPDSAIESLVTQLVTEDVPALCARVRELEAALDSEVFPLTVNQLADSIRKETTGKTYSADAEDFFRDAAFGAMKAWAAARAALAPSQPDAANG